MRDHRIKNNRWAITDKIFMDNFLAAAFVEFSTVSSTIIDGIVISRMLPGGSMAAYGIAYPIFSIIAIFFGLFAVGMQTVCSQELGRGNVKDCNRLFCSVFYISVAFSLAFSAVVLLFAQPLTFLLCSSAKDTALRNEAADYIRGIGIGIPAIIPCAVLAPAIQMDSGRKRVVASANTDAIVNILLDFLLAQMGAGLLGIGLATSIARYLRLILLLLHFRDKTHLLHFVPLHTDLREFAHILSLGTEKAWRRLGNVIRPVFVNQLILFYGGKMAMTAMSVRGSICELSEVFAVGLADTVGLLAGIYFGERNEEAQNALGRSAHRICAVFCGGVSILLLILAYPLAVFYSPEGGSLVGLTCFAIIGIAFQSPLQALVRSRIIYLQRIERTNGMRIMILISTVVFPIVSGLVLGKLFGQYGVLMCYTVGDLLSLAAVWIYYAVTNGKIIPSPGDYLNLPEDFHIEPGDIISLDIRNEEDISLTAEQITLFCRGHGLSPRICSNAAVCFEEMAVNTVKHGFPLNRSTVPMIDLRVVISEKLLIIRMQDNCPKYDVGARVAALSNADREKQLSDLGTWVTWKLADDLRYVYSFETNTIFLEFDRSK